MRVDYIVRASGLQVNMADAFGFANIASFAHNHDGCIFGKVDEEESKCFVIVSSHTAVTV